MMAQPTVQMNLRLPYELVQKLEKYLDKSGETKTAVVVAALEEYLQKKQPR